MRSSRRVWGRAVAGLLAAGLGSTVVGSPADDLPVKLPALPTIPAIQDKDKDKGKDTEKAPSPRPADESAPPKTILKPGEYPIDLGSALRLAGAENPELLLARTRISEVVAQRQYAVAQLLPNLNVGTNYDNHAGVLQQSNGNILKLNRDALYFGLGANAIAAGTVNIPGLTYNMNVGEAWFGFLVARQRVRTAQAASEAARNEVLLRVCEAYLDLLRGDARRAIAEKNRGDAAELARLTAIYARRGQGRQADAARAAVELQKRDAELAQAEADTLTASARLAALVNLDPSTRFKPIDGWAVPTPVVPDPIPLPELLAIALLNRPELAARRSEVRTSLYELSLAKVLPFSPNAIVGFSAGGFGGGSNLVASPQGFINGAGNLESGPRFGNFAGRNDFDVVVFWTFRNLGVGNLALIRAADSRVQQMRLREVEMVNVVRREVAQAKARVDARLLQIDIGAKAVELSKDAFNYDMNRIQLGQGLPLEVVDSMRLLGRSRFEYLEAIIDYNRAQFQLWVSLGRPPADTLARPVPPELAPPPMVEMPPPGPRPLPIPKIFAAPLPVKP